MRFICQAMKRHNALYLSWSWHTTIFGKSRDASHINGIFMLFISECDLYESCR